MSDCVRVRILSLFTFQVNVWEVHDPYAVIGRDRPCKSGEPPSSVRYRCATHTVSAVWVTQVCLGSSGKCFRVPAGLEEGGKRKRQRRSCLEDFGSWFTGTCESLGSGVKG